MDCIFCKIINGEIPSYKIYEDDIVIAFLDIHPDSNGHTLIIPKTHVKDIEDIPIKTLEHIIEIAKLLKKRLEEKLHIDGLTLIQNNGTIQEVKHFHLHLKPFYIENTVQDINEIYDILNTNMEEKI